MIALDAATLTITGDVIAHGGGGGEGSDGSGQCNGARGQDSTGLAKALGGMTSPVQCGAPGGDGSTGDGMGDVGDEGSTGLDAGGGGGGGSGVITICTGGAPPTIGGQVSPTATCPL